MQRIKKYQDDFYEIILYIDKQSLSDLASFGSFCDNKKFKDSEF